MKKKLNNSWLVLIICSILFITIATTIFLKSELIIDKKSYRLISVYLINETTMPVAKIITSLGSAKILSIIVIAILIIFKEKILGLTTGINLILASNLNFWLKQIFKRTRPIDLMLINEHGYSFPSGHAMTSTAFYGFLIFLIYKYVKSKNLKITLIILFTMIIIAIGISRIYLGVHYASDVIGGQIFAIIYLIIFIKMLNKHKILKS